MDAGGATVPWIVSKTRQELEKISGCCQEGLACHNQLWPRHLPPVHDAIARLPQYKVELLHGANQGLNWSCATTRVTLNNQDPLINPDILTSWYETTDTVVSWAPMS